MKYLVLIISVILLSGCWHNPFYIQIDEERNTSEKFSKEAWMPNVSFDTASGIRPRMLKDLLKNHIKMGDSKQQISELLGKSVSMETAEKYSPEYNYDRSDRNHHVLIAMPKETEIWFKKNVLSYYCGFSPSGLCLVVFVFNGEDRLIDVLRRETT